MTEQFEKAKKESIRCDNHNYLNEKDSEYIYYIRKESEAFRNMVHEAGEKATGQTVDKILFSWEET